MVDIGKRLRIRLSVVACPFFSRLLLRLPLPWVSEFKERPEPFYHSVHGLPHPHLASSPIYFHLTFKAVSRNFIWRRRAFDSQPASFTMRGGATLLPIL